VTNIPEFIEPHVIPEQLAADMARSIAEVEGCTPEEARRAVDAVAAATAGAGTPEEAVAAALAVAEKLDEHGYADDDAEKHLSEQLAADMSRADAPPMPERPPVPPPVPMFAGTYAVYDDGSGGVVLVIGQSTGEIVRRQIPAGMIKMAERFGGAGSGLAGLFG
jgi:hypothetical protein